MIESVENILLDVIDVFSPIASEKHGEDRKDGEQVEGLVEARCHKLSKEEIGRLLGKNS